MEFLVQFEVEVPDGVSDRARQTRFDAEAAAAAELAAEGRLVRLWRLSAPEEHPLRILGLYRAEDEDALGASLAGLPLYEWMTVDITRLSPHQNDPAIACPS